MKCVYCQRDNGINYSIAGSSYIMCSDCASKHTKVYGVKPHRLGTLKKEFTREKVMFT